jgi:hypothetical protein
LSAIFSECGLFRYRLERDLERSGPVVAILGVNPSTADAEKNDQTIRKDIGFGRLLGWSRIIKANKNEDASLRIVRPVRRDELVEWVIDDVMSELDTSEMTPRELMIIRLSAKYTAYRQEFCLLGKL